MKNHLKLKLIFKISITLFFIWWIYHNQKINFNNVKIGLANPVLIFVFCLFYLLQLFLAAYRTHLLIFTKDNTTMSVTNIFKISWAALFLNCISPSSLVGEVYRIKKYVDLDPRTIKDNFIYASVFSKIFSTLSLFFIFTSSSFYLVDRIPKLQNTTIISSFFLLTLTAIFTFRENILTFTKPFLLRQLNKISNSFVSNRAYNFSTYYLSLTRNVDIFGKSLLASFLIQLLNTVTFVLIIYTINPKTTVSFVELLSIVPIGIFIMTLPISFSGIGVGHVAFATLLQIFQIHNGADVFTIFFSFSLIMDLVGSVYFIYLSSSKSFHS